MKAGRAKLLLTLLTIMVVVSLSVAKESGHALNLDVVIPLASFGGPLLTVAFYKASGRDTERRPRLFVLSVAAVSILYCSARLGPGWAEVDRFCLYLLIGTSLYFYLQRFWNETESPPRDREAPGQRS